MTQVQQDHQKRRERNTPFETTHVSISPVNKTDTFENFTSDMSQRRKSQLHN
jgi:hypothetical protein